MDDHHKVKVFYAWLQHGGAQFPKVSLENINGAGRGVKVAPNCIIPQGDFIIQIPSKYIITNTVAAESDIGKLVCQHTAWTQSLAFNHNLLACFLLQERAKGSKSFWYPWIDLLPTLEQLSHIPVNWSDSKLAQLYGSQVYSFVRRQKAEWRRDFEALGIGKQFSFEDYLWARCTASTRTYSANMHGKRRSAIVPLADMLNHSPSTERMAR
jgi:hypothetical protein